MGITLDDHVRVDVLQARLPPPAMLIELRHSRLLLPFLLLVLFIPDPFSGILDTEKFPGPRGPSRALANQERLTVGLCPALARCPRPAQPLLRAALRLAPGPTRSGPGGGFVSAAEGLAVLMFLAFMGLLFTGFPVAWVLGGLAVLFTALAITLERFGIIEAGVDWAYASMTVERSWDVMTNWVLVALPMFILWA